MKTVGIIAEYNPFHNGHQYQIQYAKEILGADFVVIAMSGDFVQRGTPALLPKHIRAKMALEGGADLVLELPVSISTASAEFFAAGGVELLDSLGIIDTLCFGCENASLELLSKTAEILTEEPDFYRMRLQNSLKKGLSFPTARSQALMAYFKEIKDADFASLPDISDEELNTFFSSPNNILGIEYCKALSRQKSSIIPSPLKREGAGYHEHTLSKHSYPSASGIRYSLHKHNTSETNDKSENILRETFESMIPPDSLNTFLQGLIENGGIYEHHLDLLLHYRLLNETAESLTAYLDVNEELARRIINSRNNYQNFVQFTELLKTKELTYTRIQRALLHIVLNICKVPENIPYARVLGFRKSAGLLLREIKNHGKIPMITKLAAAEKQLNENAMQILKENTFASNLYNSLIQHKTQGAFRHEYTNPVIIL